MTKTRREVWLALEEAQAALAILTIETQAESSLINRAKAALDRAQEHLTEELQKIRNALDGI